MSTIALPRDVASAILVRAVAASQRSIVVVGSVFTAGAISVAVLSHDGNGAWLALAVGAVLGVGGLALWLLLKPSTLSATIYLVAGTPLAVAYTAALLTADETIDEPSPFLVNRAATALILVGALNGSLRSGLLWTIGGCVASGISYTAAYLLVGQPLTVGLTPFYAALLTFIAYGSFALGRRVTRQSTLDVERARRDVELFDRRRALEKRAARLIHDTVLADLAIVSMTAGTLHENARDRLRRDVDAAMSGGAGAGTETVERLAGRSALGDDLLSLIGEYQWTGVTLDVSGCDTLELDVDDDLREAVLGATRAALDNVVRHAGTDHAELVVGTRDGTLSVLVVDDGVGFAAASVAPDRLGVSSSIEARVREAGGAVRVWSGAGGTTVMLSFPIPAPEHAP